MIDLSTKLRALRKKYNYTQECLARELGVTKSVISAYEKGIRMPSYDILVHMAELFNVSTDYLLGLEKKNILDLSGLTEKEIYAVRALVDAMKSHP